MEKITARIRNLWNSIWPRMKSFLEDDDKVDKIFVILIGLLVGIVVVGAITFTIQANQKNIELTQSLVISEQKLQVIERELQEANQEKEFLNEMNREMVEDIQRMREEISELTREIEELRKYKEEVEYEKSMQKLEEMKNDPWTPTLDFLPYLQGDFETNVLDMAKVIYKEAGCGSDEEQQLQGLVLLARCFHPYSFSDGKGNLKSAILCKDSKGRYQYPWAKNGLDDIEPNESSIRNARAVLTGEVLDTPNIAGMTRNVEYANTTPLGYKTYCKVWNAVVQKWVYFGYGY